MLKYTIYLCNEIFIHLNHNEKQELINTLVPNMDSENRKAIDDLPSTKALAYVCMMLEQNGILSESKGFNKIIKALEQINRNELALKLTIYDINSYLIESKSIKYNIKQTESQILPIEFELNQIEQSKTIKINNVTIELNFEPYQFQISLAQKGCDRINNIVCSRTGSGKTNISAIICKYWYTIYSKQNKLDEFKVAFIVPTRHLANQQCISFENVFDKEVLQEINEKADEGKIHEYFKTRSILFLTAQKLINTLEKNYLKVFDFDLIVFDECHHTNDDHPYNKIMSIYYKEKSVKKSNDKKPLIIGLTASLGAGKSEPIDHLIKLCANLDCKEISYIYKPEDLADLNNNVPSILSDELVLIKPGQEINRIDNYIISTFVDILLSSKISLIGLIDDSSYKKFSNRVELIESISKKIGEPEFETSLSNRINNSFVLNDRNEITTMKFLWELNLTYLKVKDFSIDYCIQKLEEFLNQSKLEEPIEIEKICQNLLEKLIDSFKANKSLISPNNKLEKLAELIKANHNLNSRGIVLVRTRDHTRALFEYLDQHPLLPFIKPTILTGKGSNEGLMNESKQKTALNEFRSGKANFLIATDIAQEGLDVPNCNYVIRYEFVSNEIGTVQSRGRVRVPQGKCFLLTFEKSRNHRREKENREKEIAMENALKEMSKLDRNEFDSRYKFFHDKNLSSFSIKRDHSTSSSLCQPKYFSGEEVSVHCRNCGIMLFYGSDLRFREPSYYCVNSYFANELIKIDDTNSSLNQKKFFCAQISCNKELGQTVPLKRGNLLYMIFIKSIKFYCLKKIFSS